ncbi:MAG: Peptidase rane alanine aminopeptidase, partial [Phenylobacterium sp.]|nr:Peptidase rane alanine aminopeptidase [Phenylobacterium sp.]
MEAQSSGNSIVMALRVFAFLAAAVLAVSAQAQTATPPPYDPLKTFAPLTLPLPATSIRTGAGAPGPAYWQNRADYAIDAKLDTAAKVLSAEETVTYTNNSPDALDMLWLQLDQNIYKPDSRAAAMGGGRRPRNAFTEGYVIEAVSVERAGRAAPVNYLVSDTRMRVDLPQAVKAGGGQVKLHIRYHYTVPGLFGGRTAWNANKHGDIFDIAQWYPRMAVYDDVRGWDTLPYLANEFYLEYGAFDYAVTVPADMIVAGSGALTNPQDVLTPEQRARLDRARASDKTVMIRTPEEVLAAVPAKPGAVKTWRFHMDNTRDVAFTASRAFVWDAARINLPEGKTALAQSVYPPESVGENAWSRSTEYMKDAVERFSKRWYPYPWPNAINVAGPATGMEYPGIVFDGIDDKAKTLFYISAHEIGHSWFPMIVGSDERRDAWIDEGFNTFIDVYESDDFQNGLYGPKRDAEYAPGPQPPADQIAALLNDPEAPAIVSRADTIREKYRHPVTYFKTAFGLTLLREDILGPERFDPAFRKFIADWAYKHPKPSDFFRAM